MPRAKGIPHPEQRAKPNTKCSTCDKPIHTPPVYLKKYTHHFCGNACRFQYFTGKPKGPKAERIELTCKNCGETFQRTKYKASKGHHKFCSQECHWAWKTSEASIYYDRDLECSIKQRLMHFLAAHNVGAYGKPGFEDIICGVKSGFLVPNLSPHTNPLEMLAYRLRAIGHTKLASMIMDGSWQNQDLWPATINGKIMRAMKSTLPWEGIDWP